MPILWYAKVCALPSARSRLNVLWVSLERAADVVLAAAVCLCAGASAELPAAARASEGDHAAGGGGAGAHPDPDAITAAPDPRRRPPATQSTGQRRRRCRRSGLRVAPGAAAATRRLRWSNIWFPVPPGAGVSRPAGPNPPPHGHRSGPDTNPAPRHRGDHEPFCPHQHRVHVQTEPGHHCAGRSLFGFASPAASRRRLGLSSSPLRPSLALHSVCVCACVCVLRSGHPAHRTRSGEESERRGGAETSRHRWPRPRRHGHRLLRHRHRHRGRGLLDELTPPTPWTHIQNTHTHTHLNTYSL